MQLHNNELRKIYKNMQCRKIILLLFGMMLGLVATGAMAQDAKQVEVEIYAAVAKTVLLEQDEEYTSDVTADRVAKSGYYQCTLEDCSHSLADTLRGRCWYQLYFDTTNLASGQELRRTKDSLVVIGRLNRAIDSCRLGDIKNAPHEILVADSLIRDAIKTKRIWLAHFTPYCAPYHSLVVDFTIVPLSEKSGRKTTTISDMQDINGTL